MTHHYNVTYVLVDDDQDDRMLMREALLQTVQSLPVLEFEDGQELLDYLANETDNRPNDDMRWLVIMDAYMPRLDGFETLTELRSNPAWQKLPVLLLTTSDDPRLVAQARRCGASAFVAKPQRFTDYVTLFDQYVSPFLITPPSQWPADTAAFWSSVEEENSVQRA